MININIQDLSVKGLIKNPESLGKFKAQMNKVKPRELYSAMSGGVNNKVHGIMLPSIKEALLGKNEGASKRYKKHVDYCAKDGYDYKKYDPSMREIFDSTHAAINVVLNGKIHMSVNPIDRDLMLAFNAAYSLITNERFSKIARMEADILNENDTSVEIALLSTDGKTFHPMGRNYSNVGMYGLSSIYGATLHWMEISIASGFAVRVMEVIAKNSTVKGSKFIPMVRQEPSMFNSRNNQMILNYGMNQMFLTDDRITPVELEELTEAILTDRYNKIKSFDPTKTTEEYAISTEAIAETLGMIVAGGILVGAVLYLIRTSIYFLGTISVDISNSIKDQLYTVLVGIPSLEKERDSYSVGSKDYTRLTKIIDKERKLVDGIARASKVIFKDQLGNVDDLLMDENSADNKVKKVKKPTGTRLTSVQKEPIQVVSASDLSQDTDSDEIVI